jgi:hypothetical protein
MLFFEVCVSNPTIRSRQILLVESVRQFRNVINPNQAALRCPPNISPFNRTIVYLSLCAVSNHIRRFTRAEWIAHRDFAPIEALADDCLEELVAARKRETAAG